MEKIDRQFLENIFGIEPEIEDLEAVIDLLQEWIEELKEVKE